MYDSISGEGPTDERHEDPSLVGETQTDDQTSASGSSSAANEARIVNEPKTPNENKGKPRVKQKCWRPTGKNLRKSDLEFCREHTRFPDDSIALWFRSFRSECPNGRLTRSHLLELFKKVFPGGNGETFCRYIFRIFDTDGNNFLDFKEFLMALDIANCTDEKEKLEWAFRMYDVDGSGSINLEEMINIIKTLDDLEGRKPGDLITDEVQYWIVPDQGCRASCITDRADVYGIVYFVHFQ